MEKRTIVYLNSGFFDTDITVIKELTKSFQVHWFVLLSPNEPYNADFFSRFVENSSIILHLYPIKSRRRSLHFAKLIYRCLKQIKKLHPALVYTCHQDLYFPLFYKIFLRNIPLVMGIHDVLAHSSANEPLMLKVAKRLNLYIANKYVLFSKNQYSLFKSLYPTKQSCFVGMSIKDFGMPTIPKSNNNGIKKLLFFGTLQPYKGCDLLIEAFEKLLDSGVNNLRLSFYGRFGFDSYKKKCLSKIKHPDFYNFHFEFVANEDVPNIFASHDWAVFPYRDATQSGPLMINLRYGLPIIAPSHTCFTDIYDENTAILYSDSNSIKSLSEALIKVAALKDNIYSDMCKLCSKTASLFSEEVVAGRYIKTFNMTINENS